MKLRKGRDIGTHMWDNRRNREWKVGWLVFVDDTVFVSDSEKNLQKLVKEFESVYKGKRLAVNIGKSKVVKIGKNLDVNEMNISLNDSRIEVVECY